MKGDVIPDDHHVVRYCKPRYVQDGCPEVDAFRLMPDEGQLSVNWLEFFTNGRVLHTRDDREAPVDKVRGVIQLGLSSNGRFAVINVGLLKESVQGAGGTSPYVEHDPQAAKTAEGRRPARGPDPSHALVHGFPDDDYGVAVELRALVLSGLDSMYPGRIARAI